VVCAAPAGAEPLAIDVLAGLGALVDHSLVQRRAVEEEAAAVAGGEEPRFGMLHVIREYGLAQLEASDEAQATREAHAAFFADRAREAALALNSKTEGPWRGWLARERDNLRSALDWAREERHMNRTLWIGAALARDDLVRGSYTEARRRLERVLADAAGDSNIDPEARLLAVSRAGLFASAQRDLARATELAHEQLALARELGTPQYIADARAGLALLALDRRASDEALRYAEESLAVARQAGDPAAIAYALENLALARLVLGKLPEAWALAEEGLELSRQAGFLWGQGVNAGVLALIRCRKADPMGALQVLREGAAALRAHGGLHGLVGILQAAACAWAVAGEGPRGARALGAAEAAMAHAEGTPGMALLRWTEEMTAPARAALGEERWAQAFAAGRALTLEEALADALDEKGAG
jgi:tetratricopeptide (TPR) repeat protein